MASDMICSDISIDEMVAYRPKSLSKLAVLNGWFVVASPLFVLVHSLFVEKKESFEVDPVWRDVSCSTLCNGDGYA